MNSSLHDEEEYGEEYPGKERLPVNYSRDELKELVYRLVKEILEDLGLIESN